jgi:hypothetical protein
MTENINAPIVEAPVPFETPEEKRKREQRVRKQRSRLKEKMLKGPKVLSPEENRRRTKIRWHNNFDVLSEESRKKVEDQLADWTYVRMLCRTTSDGIRDNRSYGSAEESGIAFCPEQALKEIEEFAKQYPPTKDLEPWRKFEFTQNENLEDTGFYFQTYGLPCDSVDTIFYNDFVHCFVNWYRQNRDTLVLVTTTEDGPEFAVSWEEVDQIIEKSPRLKYAFVVTPQLKQPVPAAAVVAVQSPRSSETEQVQRTLKEIRRAGIHTQEL